MVSKNENLAEIKESRIDEMVRRCKLRNIQLNHSQTIITAFMRILTAENIDQQRVAARLLENLPHILERQSQSYTEMITYLGHLAEGGERLVKYDITAASVYISRSAAFAELKKQVYEACKKDNWAQIKEACQGIVTKHAEIAALWHLEPESLKVQNMKVYKALLAADFDNVDQGTKTKNIKLMGQVFGDAEIKRVPWQVGKKGQFGDSIEPLDEAFLHAILTTEKMEPTSPATIGGDISGQKETAMTGKEDRFAEFESSLRAEFIKTMQKSLSPEGVCGIMNVPVSAMRVFVKALNPEFAWEDLGMSFKGVILELVKNRSNRQESQPVRRLLQLRDGKSLQVER